MNTDLTRELLSFDPLQAAEDLTGKHYQEDESTSALGFALALSHGAAKNEHLLEQGDTTLSNELDRYTHIITEMGFEKVLELPFMGKAWGSEPPKQETYFIYAHKQRGLLLSFDTFDTDSINGGHIYYCWHPKDGLAGKYGITSSGHWVGDEDGHDGYWAGYHDCREALRYKMDALAAAGTFLSSWPADHNHFLWLLHYMDTKADKYDYKAINAERIAMLPDWVREMIGC